MMGHGVECAALHQHAGHLNTCVPLHRYVAAKTSFFRASIRLPDLENRLGVMQNWCREYAGRNGIDVNALSSTLGGGYAKEFGGPGQANPTILAQCTTEQKWMRESMLRTLLYLQASSFFPPFQSQSAFGLIWDA